MSKKKMSSLWTLSASGLDSISSILFFQFEPVKSSINLSIALVSSWLPRFFLFSFSNLSLRNNFNFWDKGKNIIPIYVELFRFCFQAHI